MPGVHLKILWQNKDFTLGRFFDDLDNSCDRFNGLKPKRGRFYAYFSCQAAICGCYGCTIWPRIILDEPIKYVNWKLHNFIAIIRFENNKKNIV